MTNGTRGPRRFLRWLLLIGCAGGVLAADNSWVDTLGLDFATPQWWFSSAATSDMPEFAAPSDTSFQVTPPAEISMTRLLHGLLFSRRSGSWTLDSRVVEADPPPGRQILEFPAINQSRGESFPSFTTAAGSSRVAAISAPASTGVTAPTAVTATGTWAVDNSGTWSNTANWAGGTVADGQGATADFTQVDLTANRTVTLDVSRTIGNLMIGDTNGTHSYTLDAAPNATLTFSYSTFGPTGILAQSATSAGDTISAPILIGNVNYLSIQNASSAPLTISGSISSAAGSKTVQFSGSGIFNVTGAISDGASGNIVTVGAVSFSTVTLTGTNTYTGGTSLVGSTLFINGDNSAATGLVSVANAGSLLGGTGISGGSVAVGGGATITGGTDSTVGTFTIGSVTMQRNLAFNPGEASAAYLANLSGTTSDLLNISGTLSIVGNSHLHFVGAADGITTYTLATYASETGHFIVDNLPAGYSLLYLPTELDLVPTAIPEPATWLGGALALAALTFVARKRARRI